MSSLLQFNGTITKQGVHLEFYKTRENARYPESAICGDSIEDVWCHTCKRFHPLLYIAVRKPKGMFGPWVIFRYNGKDNIPDLSHPIATFTLPRDARPLTAEENALYWHK